MIKITKFMFPLFYAKFSMYELLMLMVEVSVGSKYAEIIEAILTSTEVQRFRRLNLFGNHLIIYWCFTLILLEK